MSGRRLSHKKIKKRILKRRTLVRKKTPERARRQVVRKKTAPLIRSSSVIPDSTFFNPQPPVVFEAAPLKWNSLVERVTIPQKYGDHKINLQVADPWLLHAYWELSGKFVKRREEQLKKHGLTVQKWILRVYEEPPQPARIREDIHLHPIADNWYLHVDHDHSYFVEIGIVASNDSFYPLARSNKVRTPRFGMSSVIDPEWKCLGEEYWELFALSGGFGVGSSFMETHESFLQRMAQLQ